MDDFGDDSGSDWDEVGSSRSGRFLDKDLTRWGHGRRSKRVVKRVNFSAASDLFGVSVTRVLGNELGGVGTGGPCLHLVIEGRCRWCLRFPRHLSTLPLWVVRGGVLGRQWRMWT